MSGRSLGGSQAESDDTVGYSDELSDFAGPLLIELEKLDIGLQEKGGTNKRLTALALEAETQSELPQVGASQPWGTSQRFRASHQRHGRSQRFERYNHNGTAMTTYKGTSKYRPHRKPDGGQRLNQRSKAGTSLQLSSVFPQTDIPGVQLDVTTRHAQQLLDRMLLPATPHWSYCPWLTSPCLLRGTTGILDERSECGGGPIATTGALQQLGQEMLSFSHWITLDERELQARRNLIARVQNVVSCTWQNSIAHVFGSSESGLCLPSSDIDFVIYGVDFTHKTAKSYINELSKALSANGLDPYPVLSAKVPLVKFVDRTSRLCGDVCFCMPNAVRSVALVNSYIKKYPVAKPLIFILKVLLRQHKLNSVCNGGLSSYAVTLIVVCYLQLCGCDHVHINFDSVNVGLHMMQFLSFFANHDLSYAFAPGCEQHIALVSSYHRPGRIEVRDPLDSTNDVTKGCSVFPTFQLLLAESLRAFISYDPAEHGPSMLAGIVDTYDSHFLNRWKQPVTALAPMPVHQHVQLSLDLRNSAQPLAVQDAGLLSQQTTLLYNESVWPTFV